MKKILLVTTLLSIAVSENILMENHPRLKTTWICDKQLWNRKIKRIPRTDIPSKIEEFINYDDEQFPRILDTRFISESKKLPPMTVFRRHDLARFDLSSDKSKLDKSKPRILISIDIQDCSTSKNYCKQNQNWQIQKPFYVEEPRWLDIDVDYIDSSQEDDGDPYVLTRGKKIYRINDPEQVSKTIEATLDYPSKKKLLIKSRVRRSVEMNEGSQANIWKKQSDGKNNWIKERNNSFQDMNRDVNNTVIIKIGNKFEKSFKIDKLLEDKKTKSTRYDIFNNKKALYEKDDTKNLTKRSLRGFKFTKQNQISKIIDIKQQKIQRGNILNDTKNDSIKTIKINQIKRLNNSKSHIAINKINKKSMLLNNQELSEVRKKREIYDANSKKDDEKNEIKQMKNKVYVKNDLGTSANHFILSPDKDLINSEIERLNKKDTDRNKFIERWKLHNGHRQKLEKIEGEIKEDEYKINNNIGITDSQLPNEYNSKSFEAKPSNYREKRNTCKNCKIKSEFQDEWLKEMEKKIQLSLERRDKHSDILERLSLNEPYIISRGKKMLQDFSSNPQDINNEDRVKMISLPVAKSLETLLKKMSRCNDDNCINANELSNERLSPRDRRGTLDEILAVYDPYYVARGKRMSRNQQDILFETDARQ